MLLTLAGYQRMGAQRFVFDDWLSGQGLKGEWIFEARFGEGVMEARCFDRDASGRAYLVDGEPAEIVKRFRLTTPPPEFVVCYCEQAA